MIGHPYILAQANAEALPLADDSVQLVVTSPPYMDARTYGIGAQRGCQQWIDWMLGVVRECIRVCTGPVIVNCGGVVRDWAYWPPGATIHTKRTASGSRAQAYIPPKYADPGNLLYVGPVGGGLLGHALAHENEAPFHIGVPSFFIKGWTKPGDIVLDPFSGSGTTVDAARSMGRIGIGFDLRFNQCELATRRIQNPVSAKPVKASKVKGEKFLFGNEAA